MRSWRKIVAFMLEYLLQRIIVVDKNPTLEQSVSFRCICVYYNFVCSKRVFCLQKTSLTGLVEFSISSIMCFCEINNSSLYVFNSSWNKQCWFLWREESGEPKEKPSEKVLEPITNSTHVKSGWGVEPRSQRALSVLHHPCFRNKQSNKDKTRFILLLTRLN